MFKVYECANTWYVKSCLTPDSYGIDGASFYNDI